MTARPIATRSRAGGTREAILDILRRHDERSVDDLAGELGFAGATVRRHLDVLLRDGYVAVSQVRGRTGRPRYAFSLSEEGAELFGRHNVRITRRLLHEIAQLTAEETAGRGGEAIADLVFAKLSDRLAAEYAPRVGGRNIEERARAVAALLEDEGFEVEVDASAGSGSVDTSGVRGGDLRLLARGCPSRRLLGEPLDCERDRELLAILIGAPVEADLEAAAGGGPACVFLVRAG